MNPESLILTRLFAAQRRLRFVRGLKASLIWFAAGTLASTAVLLLLWNWNFLPGPWQWLAAAGRPREVLWLPLLTGLGGFASRWLMWPNSHQTAHRLDRMMDSQERILTSVDWILSEKPRTQTSERLLENSAILLKDEHKFLKGLKSLESIPKKHYALLLFWLLPLALLIYLPGQLGVDPAKALWMGEDRVDQLREELLKELEQTRDSEDPTKKLEQLLKNLEKKDPANPDLSEQEVGKRELQRVVDQLRQQAQAQEKARELLETLAQRARQSQKLSPEDLQALEILKQKLTEPGQSEELDQAERDWRKGDFSSAAESLESLQRELGESAQELSQSAEQAASKGDLEGDQGQDFDESQGDQFSEDGRAQGESQGSESGQGQGQGEEGQTGAGEGQGQPGGAPGTGTTLDDAGDSPNAQGQQSLRRSESESLWTEEYQHLHTPERTEFQNSQTKVRGQLDREGPRFRTAKEGRGGVTEPAAIDGSDGLLEYREEAENAILRETVPADYRDNVRIYFESLNRE